jgi:hypothetical protein
MSSLRCWSLLSFLLLPFSLSAEIHQWTDAQGHHHFGDKPSEQFKSQQLDLDVPAPSPVPPLDKTRVQSLDDDDIAKQRLLEQIVQRDLAEKQALAESNLAMQRCIEGRERIAVLEQAMPVYRDENNVLRAHSSVDRYQGQRAYIKDSLRDKEIDIAQGVILKNCKEPYDEAKQQQAHTKWLNKQYCDAAKIELQHYQQPKLRALKQTLRGKKAVVKHYCTQ